MVEFTLNLEDRYKIWSNRIQYLRSENERVRDRTRGEKEKARNRKEVGRDNFYAFLFNQYTLITSAIVWRYVKMVKKS